MSFIGDLSKYTGYLGRGLEDLFTLGGTEIARNNGGKFGDKFFGVLDKGVGANFEAGAAGGSSILGAHGLGLSGGSGAMTPYTPTSTPVMSQAGSTLGNGMGSPMNLGTTMPGSVGTPASASPMSAVRMLQGMRTDQPSQPNTQSQQQAMARIYQMFPNLRSRLGGSYGGY